jgi:peptide/nickel transport system substrate-binding protein
MASLIAEDNGMKKFSAVLMLAAASLLFSGYMPEQKANTPKSDAKIVKGGIMRVISANSAQVIGYPPEMGATDINLAFPGLESLMTYTGNHKFSPYLCSKVDINPAKLSITFHLRKGILFHDGTELTADVARWIFQLLTETKKLQYAENIKSIDLLDKYTFRLNLEKYHNMLIYSYGIVYMFSKDAILKHGKDWARVNCVGTGPFRLVEFKRDVHLHWTKYDNYWRKDAGLPYLDGVEVRFIPDPVTASSILEAGQADLWIGVGAQYQKKMSDKGMLRQASYSGLSMWLMPNYLRPDGKWKSKQLREALEYAIDKAAITKALGYGFNVPMNLICPPGAWGYDAGLNRKYDPVKARQLIAEAGYREPVKVKLLTEPAGRDTTSAIKGYLDATGFQCEIDIADSGRYFNSINVNGWDDIVFAASGIDPNYLVTITNWFSPQSRSKMPSWVRPEAFSELWRQAIAKDNIKEQEALTAKMVKYIHTEALICPLYKLPSAGVMQPYVHTNYLLNGLQRWNIAEDWMNKR